MKKILTSTILLLSVILFSCKKEHSTNNNTTGKTYAVNFNLEGFTQTTTPITNSSKTQVNAVVAPTINSVYYLVYKLFDSNNTLKKTLKVKYDAPGFGTFKDTLSAGNYTAVFAGVQQYFVDDNTKFSYNTNSSTINTFYDSFTKKVPFTVGSTDLNTPVVLKRSTAQLQVVITDAIPVGVTNFKIEIRNELHDYSYLDDAPSTAFAYNASIYNIFNSSYVGTVNYSPPLIAICNTVSPTTVVISAQTNTNQIVAKKTIPNITFVKNTRTVLSGNLFTPSADANGFHVQYNQAFTDSTKVNF